jgi:hypothetical protein
LMGRKGSIVVENLVREFRNGPKAVDAPRAASSPANRRALPAYAIGFALVLAFALWALFGLRREGVLRRKGER